MLVLSFLAVAADFPTGGAVATAQEKEREKDRDREKEPGKEPRRRDARLNFRTFSYTMSQQKVKSKVTRKSGSGPTAAESTTEPTSKEDRWNFYSSLPVIGGTFFANGLVVDTSVWGLLGFVGGATSIGKELSPSMHAGLYSNVNYRVAKTSQSVDSASQKSHDSSRGLAMGPYVHLTSIVDRSALEAQFILTYLHEGKTDTASGYDADEKTGFGIDAAFEYVKPLSRTLSYTGGISFTYQTFNKGEEIDESGTTTTTTKISSDATTTVVLSLLGIRLSI
jgi:hypothetical protein